MNRHNHKQIGLHDETTKIEQQVRISQTDGTDANPHRTSTSAASAVRLRHDEQENEDFYVVPKVIE